MKKSLKIFLVILVILIAIRISLPYVITDYVNKVLDDVPEYSGSIQDVDLNLYRGAYKIRELKMVKTGEKIPVPFLDIELVDLSIEWGALFDGSIVGEVELIRPVVNFAAIKQTGTEADWTQPIKDLMPLQINRFAVVEGKVTYRDFESEPEVNISLDSLQLEATNLNNVEDERNKLPSTITVNATSIGDGKLYALCHANILKEIPDFDLDFKFEEVNLPALNNFTEAYSKLDFEKGTFNLYVEMAVSDGALEGYVRPILTDIKVLDLSRDKKNPLNLIWEGVAGALMGIFKNQPRDQFATQVPLEGDLNSPDTDIWPTIGNIFKNAFIEAFQKDTDNSVNFKELSQ